ncbi:MAG TPA: DUF389 domain-containing protein, partial [Phaeodactylibacter sp.]|nr:DUF389 domain-containing protein [Phaeodactylibacter sp.]
MPEANNINPSPAPEPKDVKNSFAKAWSELSAFLFSLIDLNQGLDREGTIVNIKNNKKMEGANAWLLMCSIMIASLGLDLNSPAVIIGAMLISPLMSPILGVGLAVGINDRKTLSISLNHFGIAIAIALVTSTLYFYFSPFKGRETSEIIARTTPTLLDVAVAFFGGIAGIISGSRKDKSNAIPGVAIATALMPPLCVTGFGIANQNWAFTLNSFYLFFMNATFVALATFIIVRFLRFPHKAFSDKSEHRRTQLIIAVFSILMIVPSIYIFSGILRRTNQEYIINQFLDEKFPTAICQLERIQNTDSVDVKVLLGKYLSADSIQALRDELYQKGGRHFYLDFLQDAESRQDIEKLKSTQANFLEVIKNSKEIQHKKDKTIEELQLAIDSLTRQDLLFKHLAMEAKILFP